MNPVTPDRDGEDGEEACHLIKEKNRMLYYWQLLCRNWRSGSPWQDQGRSYTKKNRPTFLDDQWESAMKRYRRRVWAGSGLLHYEAVWPEYCFDRIKTLNRRKTKYEKKLEQTGWDGKETEKYSLQTSREEDVTEIIHEVGVRHISRDQYLREVNHHVCDEYGHVKCITKILYLGSQEIWYDTAVSSVLSVMQLK